jgi:hypothetical protein
LALSRRNKSAADREAANFSFSRSAHRALSSADIADRLAIRELLDAYAHCAGRRDVEGQISLFTADAEFLLLEGGMADPISGSMTEKAYAPVWMLLVLQRYIKLDRFGCQKGRHQSSRYQATEPQNDASDKWT